MDSFHSPSRRKWLKTAATVAVAAAAAPMLVSCRRQDDSAGATTAGGDRKWPDAARIIGSLPGEIGCTGCEACMPCAYGVDIPGNFALYNRSLSDGDIPADSSTLDTADGRARALRFLDRAEREIGDTHMAHRCIGCGHCLGSCPRHIRIIADLHSIGSLTDLIRERQCLI